MLVSSCGFLFFQGEYVYLWMYVCEHVYAPSAYQSDATGLSLFCHISRRVRILAGVRSCPVFLLAFVLLLSTKKYESFTFCIFIMRFSATSSECYFPFWGRKFYLPSDRETQLKCSTCRKSVGYTSRTFNLIVAYIDFVSSDSPAALFDARNFRAFVFRNALRKCYCCMPTMFAFPRAKQSQPDDV